MLRRVVASASYVGTHSGEEKVANAAVAHIKVAVGLDEERMGVEVYEKRTNRVLVRALNLIPQRVSALDDWQPSGTSSGAILWQTVLQQPLHRSCLGSGDVGQAQTAGADVTNCRPSQYSHNLSRAAAIVRHWQHVCNSRR